MNKFIGKITSFIFVVNDLFVLKCKVFVLYDDMRAEYIGQVQPDPYQYKGELVYINKEDLKLDKDEYLDEDLINIDVIIGDEVVGKVKKIEI